MNDERMITAIKNRSEAAINEVITKYSKLLWSVAGAVLNNMGSTQDVEECVADTFIYQPLADVFWVYTNKARLIHQVRRAFYFISR